MTVTGGVVTVSRWFGAGGVQVAESLAGGLGYQKVDREIVEEAARRLGIEPDVAEPLDERVPALIEDAGLALATADPGAGWPQQPLLHDRALADAVGRVVHSLGQRGGYVILGRGGQAVLHDHPRAVHLQLVADLEDRARRVSGRRGIGIDEARALCRQVDADRAAYVRRFHGIDIDDPLLYDAVLNTTRLGLEGSWEAAAAIVLARLGSA